jgi:iron complex outermembrane recepter protein
MNRSRAEATWNAIERSLAGSLYLALLSTTCAVIAPAAAAAQAAATTDIELSELSVTGEGPSRSLNGDLYGAGGAVGPVPGYVASRSTVGTKTDTPILETAQSVSVVGRQQIQDQNALTVTQALRYTPGVFAESRGGAGSTRLELFNIRGFTAPVFLDQMAIIGGRDANTSIDVYRLERIDIIKGSPARAASSTWSRRCRNSSATARSSSRAAVSTRSGAASTSAARSRRTSRAWPTSSPTG